MSNLGKDLDTLIESTNAKNACRVKELISGIRIDHGDDVAEKFAQLIGDKSYPVNGLVITARTHGYKIGKDSVTRHRRRGVSGGCDCV